MAETRAPKPRNSPVIGDSTKPGILPGKAVEMLG
jgi:hypothetical protein